jgi:tRNA nucleotidyltransferase/poly(A) polymerase
MKKHEYDEIVKNDMMLDDRIKNDGGYGGFAITPHYVDENGGSLYWTKHGFTGDLTNERKKSYMDNVKAVNIKNKCKIGGLGNTSAACNQGDISNIELSTINEEENNTYTGCLMLFFDIPKWNIITSKIKNDDLYNVEGYGIEDEPHVTILYGINNNISEKDVLNLVEKLVKPDIEVNIESIDCFENDEFDVVKFNVNSELLHKLNFVLTKKFDYRNNYPDYKPHMTIAYVKSGTGNKYKFDFDKPLTIKGLYFKYSKSENSNNETHDVLNNFKDLASNNINSTFDINENKTIMNEDTIKLNELPFIKDIQEKGGQIYSVGGIVRDELLGKESKDLDILITGVPMDSIENIVSKYGKVDSVGKSFGVLKFKPEGYEGEDVDIAIPRSEKPTGEGGHKGFEVKSDHNLSIEDDLYRRDLTINALAKDLDGNIIDPFGGLEDIKKRQISMVNPDAFSDDPLRMLRSIQFSARFGFKIEENTLKAIQNNAHRIKEIPSERILTEFDKIVTKGNPFVGAKLLKESGLLKNIFGNDKGILISHKWDLIENIGEFVWMLSHNLVDDSAEFYKNELDGDLDNYKIIKGLSYAYDNVSNNNVENRVLVFNLNKITPNILNSKILPDNLYETIKELKNGKYPLTNKDLAVNGNDLIKLGLKGKEIGDMLRKVLINIYADKLDNDFNNIVEFINNKNE